MFHGTDISRSKAFESTFFCSFLRAVADLCSFTVEPNGNVIMAVVVKMQSKFLTMVACRAGVKSPQNELRWKTNY